MPALRFPQLVGFLLHPRATLESLASSAPSPFALDDLAAVLGVDPALLLRVSQRRQPLPSTLVGPIAAALGVQVGEVMVAAGSVLSPEASKDARTLRPLPPDRCLSDPLFQVPYRPTTPVHFE